MQDKLVRAMTSDGMVKAVAVSTRELTEQARNIHKTLPVATAALGRTLAAASMLGNALKEEKGSGGNFPPHSNSNEAFPNFLRV